MTITQVTQVTALEAHNRLINRFNDPVNFGEFMYWVFKGATSFVINKALTALKQV